MIFKKFEKNYHLTAIKGKQTGFFLPNQKYMWGKFGTLGISFLIAFNFFRTAISMALNTKLNTDRFLTNLKKKLHLTADWPNLPRQKV